MKAKDRLQELKQKISEADKECVRVERMTDGNYNVTITGKLAEKFMAANKSLQSLTSRKISEAVTFGPLLDKTISNFELNSPPKGSTPVTMISLNRAARTKPKKSRR